MGQYLYQGAWEAEFIWFPKKVLGRLVWLKTVYRRRAFILLEDGFLRDTVEYGTVFDLIKNEEGPC